MKAKLNIDNIKKRIGYVSSDFQLFLTNNSANYVYPVLEAEINGKKYYSLESNETKFIFQENDFIFDE